MGLSGVDIEVYRGGGETVLRGESLYDFTSAPIGLPFTYPPISALLFTPLGMLPLYVATGVWTFVCVLALEGVIWVLLGTMEVTSTRRRATLTAAGALAALALAPVLANFWNGQINTILMLLIVVDLAHGTHRSRGVGVGLAAGIKLTPLIFVPYLLLSRQTRTGLVAAVTFAGTVLVGFLLLPGDSVRYWFDVPLDIKRMVPAESAWEFNQSVLGTLQRLPGSDDRRPWLLLAAAVGCAGLAVAVRAGRLGHQLTGMVACALTGLLVSPVSWPFHWVWWVPLLVLWARRAWRDDRAGEKAGVCVLYLLLAASSYWTFTMIFAVPVPPVLRVVFAELFVVIGTVALAALAVFPRHRAGHRVHDGRSTDRTNSRMSPTNDSGCSSGAK
ncbi:glycosyltransferase 87 family protein [Amycolatopsis cihanbeyliensis]|uniref:Alpha-1,2-mannosyltransferase n=1 Tax=Amycolatopsis cihanbeyliensis TaxID=1128664 RepID=A0A542DQI2_AMYCI|nr:glycosyltransferase 87 family protein [Amycolatopsis cihanbeyliensis]TQJ05254.1 alpha-1,2-mannosyltransferase [Amycolatopsis cihanbeyliensis]